MKKIIALFLCLTLLVSFVSCASGGETPADSNAPATTDEPAAEDAPATEDGDTAELDIWVRNTYYDEIIAATDIFEADTGIVFNVTEPSDMSNDLALALSAGEEPDVISVDCVLVPYYSSIGALADITEPFNELPYKDTFSGGLIDLATYEGVQYAVPFAPDLSVMIYNKDMFEAAGLDPESPPKSWDELIEAAEALTTDDTYGYMFAASSAGSMMFTFGPYIWAAGGDFTQNGGTESALDSPEAAQAMQLIYDMLHTYQVTPASISSYDWGTLYDAFKAQQVGMVVLGSSGVGDIVNGNFDFNAGAALIPGPDGETFSSFSGGDSIAILDSTENFDASWDFVEYCLSEDFQVGQLAANDNIPARTDLFDNEIYAEHPEYTVLQEALEVGRAPYSVKYNEMYTPWLDAIQFALNQEKTPEEALADAKTEIDAILAE